MQNTATTLSTGRDDYGRKVAKVHGPNGAVLGVIVTLPKAYAAKYGYTHLTNDWSAIRVGSDPQASVAYHRNLRDARAHAIATATRFLQAAE